MIPHPPVRGSRKRNTRGGKYVRKEKLRAMTERKITATALVPLLAFDGNTDRSFQLKMFPARIAQKNIVMS
jgi:hypothetical protein